MTPFLLAMYLVVILVVFGVGFVVAWHALDPKLHVRKEPPSQP